MHTHTRDELLALVRSARRVRAGSRQLAALLESLDGRFMEAEQAVSRAFRGDPTEGAALVRAYTRLAALDGSAAARGRAARLAASFALHRGRAREALSHSRRAEELLVGAARDGARIGAAAALLRLGQFDEAIAVCRRARRSARRRGDELLEAGALLNEAVAVHEGGAPGRALPLYDRARDALDRIEKPLLAAQAVNNGANALVALDRFVEAEARFDEAARRYAATGLRHSEILCRANRGALLLSADRLGDADAELDEVERAFLGTGDPVEAALVRIDRAETLLRAGVPVDAAHAARGALASVGRRLPPAEAVRARLLLGDAELALGNAEAALRTVREIERAGSPGAAAARGRAADLRGRALAALGRSAPARRALEEAARAFRERPVARARALVSAAGCALRDDDLAGARRLLRRAATDGAADVPSLRFAYHGTQFDLAVAAERPSDAELELESALRALDDLRAALGPDTLRSAVLEGREAWAARAVRHVLGGEDGARRALELIERLRARAFQDLLGASRRVGGAATPEVERLRARLTVLERRLGARGNDSLLRMPYDVGPAAPPAHAGPGELAEAERALIRAVDRAYAVTSGASRRSAESIRRGLPDGTVVLSYFVDESATTVFALRRDGLTATTVPTGGAALAETVARLRFRLGQFTLGAAFRERHAARLARETDDVLQQLARTLLAPVAHALRGARRVVVSPHGPLHAVPFAALPFDGAPLVALAPVSATPSLAALAGRAARARGRPLVLAHADERAPSMLAEAECVSAMLPHARVLLGDAARSDALAADGAVPSCLHVIAHGRFRADAPAMSGMALADGWWRAIDLRLRRLDGALVVLSGCETGVSRVGAGNEAHGLVRGVLAAGARALVASLWPVDDPATARLMERFHAAHAQGAAPDAALRASQLEAVCAGLHPWYWAGFAAWMQKLPDSRYHPRALVAR